MFNIFKKEESEKENNHPSIMAVACLLIHSAKLMRIIQIKKKKLLKMQLLKWELNAKKLIK